MVAMTTRSEQVVHQPFHQSSSDTKVSKLRDFSFRKFKPRSENSLDDDLIGANPNPEIGEGNMDLDKRKRQECIIDDNVATEGRDHGSRW